MADLSRQFVETNFKGQPYAKKSRKEARRRERSYPDLDRLSSNEWRLAVLRRDRCCKLCGYSGQHLSAHHLIFKSRCEEVYRTDPRNGLALCNGFAKGCHEAVHQHKKRIPLRVLPRDVVACLEEQGLRWERDGDGPLMPVGTLASYFE